MCVFIAGVSIFPPWQLDVAHVTVNINGKNTDHSQPQAHEDTMETNHQMDHPFSVSVAIWMCTLFSKWIIVPDITLYNPYSNSIYNWGYSMYNRGITK